MRGKGSRGRLRGVGSGGRLRGASYGGRSGGACTGGHSGVRRGAEKSGDSAITRSPQVGAGMLDSGEAGGLK